MESQIWEGVPKVKQVARAPIVRSDFSIRWEPGWDEKTGVWVTKGLGKDTKLVDGGFDIRRIFKVFPFVDRKQVADALAAALTPLLSTAIDDPLPGLIVTARKPGSGKTVLTTFCSMIGNGGKTFTTWRGTTELEKMIGTYVAEDHRVVIFDNIKNDIESTTMESVITSREISYRKMYSHSSVSLRSNTSWFMTANGAIVSSDMVRRCIVVMLDKEATPGEIEWEGSIPRAAMDMEAALVTLMCHMIEEWRDAGCKTGSVLFSNFERWSEVTSGILEHAGITGMWEAREEIVGDAIQTDDEDEIPVVEAIAWVMGGADFRAGELWEKANDSFSSFTDPKVMVVREWLKSTGKVKSGAAKPSIPTGRALHTIEGKTFPGCNIKLVSKVLDGKKYYRCTTLDGSELPVRGQPEPALEM
jgi:hypothetical protein